eukprot:CAMPEP_0205813782 /NCGR_PEP_ID=MMETSP0205-20121125/18570_1 /ASSEMBLY_ACC=CAM_ASM_000278 /TAXON_ID=36767 /ORGANISM="Euplotes focardii, Strain TN1" /LENGTH=91 /DNA_ID=CAMNT_0053096473 /DNA_START=202 /DNA_END=477 /DNA_ORIENTATION=-
MTFEFFYSLSSSDIPNLDGLIISTTEKVVSIDCKAVDPSFMTFIIITISSLKIEGSDDWVTTSNKDCILMHDHDFDGFFGGQERLGHFISL